MKTSGELLPDTVGEETVDNETFFNDLVSGLTSATNRLREENAREMLRETLEWIGRVPGNPQEQNTLSSLRERAEAVLSK